MSAPHGSVMPATARAAAPERDLIDAITGFARTLRHAGVPANPQWVQAMLGAMAHLDVLDPSQVYWAGRLTLCADPDDLPRYDSAFALYFGGRGERGDRTTQTPPSVLQAAPFEVDTAAEGTDSEEESPTFAVRANRHEVLRHKDVATLTGAEREQLRRLFALLAPRLAGRRSPRYTRVHRGRVDLDRTVRQLLRFAHAAVRSAPLNTEVFTVGTRLTRVTRELRARDPGSATRLTPLPRFDTEVAVQKVLNARVHTFAGPSVPLATDILIPRRPTPTAPFVLPLASTRSQGIGTATRGRLGPRRTR